MATKEMRDVQLRVPATCRPKAALVGYLLMAAGAVITIISLALVARKRQSTSITSTSVDPNNGQQVTRNDRRDTV